MNTFLILLLIIISISFGFFIASLIKFTAIGKLYTKVHQQRIDDYIAETDELIDIRNEKLEGLNQKIIARMEDLDNVVGQEASIAQTVLETEKKRVSEALSSYVATLEFSYTESEEEFDQKIKELREELNRLKAEREAIIQISLREKELQEKENYYKIPLSKGDLEDIAALESIKLKLRKPEILSKLIWTTYYQKGITTVCNNVLKQSMVCGIYKITDSISGLIYIGQSVNISQRWKDHVKTALGAGTTSTNNKLYSAMQEDGIHNFTFELVEEVLPEKLNEVEAYYIDFFKSNIYGLNTVKGVNK